MLTFTASSTTLKKTGRHILKKFLIALRNLLFLIEGACLEKNKNSKRYLKHFENYLFAILDFIGQQYLDIILIILWVVPLLGVLIMRAVCG